ncbi:MAG: archease [Candidatus Nezhaarchaeales archaeon]
MERHNMSIKFLDHPSDLYVEVKANNLEEAFALCGLAVYEAMTNTNLVGREEEVKVVIEGFDLYSLLYNWIEELIYLFDSKGFLGSYVKVDEMIETNGKFVLKATILGEKYNPEKHESKTAIKAATYHLMEIKRENCYYVIRYVLDI